MKSISYWFNQNKQMTLKEVLFFFFFTVMSIAKAWGLNSGDSMYYIFSSVAFFVWILIMICSYGRNVFRIKEIKNSWIELATIICLLAISLIMYFTSRKLGPILLFLVIIAVKEIDIDRVLKLCSMFWIFTFVIKVTLSLCGIIPMVYTHKDNAIYGVREVSGLGYPHPNNAYLVFAISVFFIYYLNNISSKLFSLIVIILNFILYFTCYSVTGFTIVVVTILGFEIINRKKKMVEHVFSRLSTARGFSIAYLFPMLISILSPLLFCINDDGFKRILNKLSTGRIEYSHEYMTNYPITLWGQIFDERTVAPIIDNAFVYILLQYGIIYFAFFTIGYYLVVKSCIENKNIKRLFICILFLYYGLFEQFIQNPFINFTLLFVGEAFWQVFDKYIVKRKNRNEHINST